MKEYRLNRLFNPRSGRCFDVAVDHGMPGEPSFLTGIEDMEAVVDTLVDANPDAIQLAVGQAELLQRKAGRDKPALVLRTDTANVYGPEMPEETWTAMIDDPVGHAVRLDAACVVVNLLDIPGAPNVRRECVEAHGLPDGVVDHERPRLRGRLRRVDVRRVRAQHQRGLVAAGVALEQVGLADGELDRVGAGVHEHADRALHVLDAGEHRGLAGHPVVDRDVEAAARGGMEQAVEPVLLHDAGH